MAKITITSKGKTLQELDINKTITIGREVGDIMIKHPAVSARHAKIEKSGNSFTIVDLGSTNGTLVNEESVSSKSLIDGDVITIGKYNMIFSNPDNDSTADADRALGGEDLGGRTMVMDSGKIQSIMAETRKAQTGDTAAGGDGSARLFLSQSSGAPKTMKLKKDNTTIGSGDECDITIKGITIGKLAAAVIKSGSGHRVEFKGGMAKLKVNGELTESRDLSDGDKFTIGSFDFEYRL